MKSIALTTIIFLLSFRLVNAQWFAVDSGFTDDYVAALFSYNNKIYIGGQFDVLPNHSTAIYSWDGLSLTAVSPPLQGNVSCLTQFGSELTAFGVFKQFQSTTIPNGTVRWDGTNWYNLGAGITDMGQILAASEYQGSLYVGGSFSYIDNIYRRCIARWDGSQWYSVGSGLSTGLSDIQSMAVYNGELYIGGYFSSIDGVSATCIAKYNGSAWVQVASGLNGTVKCLYVDSINNRLYASGNFNASGTLSLPSNIAYWDGSNWNAVANSQSMYPLTVCVYKNQLYAGFTSKLTNTLGDTLRYIARYDGADWQPLDSGLNSTPLDLVVYNDDLIVGGGFTSAGNITANRIARWHYSPNAINEIDTQKKSFEIIPNPAKEYITINFFKPISVVCKVQVFDIVGQTIFNQTSFVQNQFSIPLPTIPNGVYILQVNYEGKKEYSKFIKQ